MNQYFNLTRFGHLLRKHATENMPRYALSTAVLAGGVLVVLGSLTYISHRPLDHEMQIILFLFGMLAAGGIFTSSVFAEFGHPRGSAPALLLPASHFEKYLVAWLYSLPVFWLVYTAVFMVLNYLVLQLGSQGRPYEVYDFARGAREWAAPLLSYALLHGMALWGAIFFRRQQAIKTAFLFFGLLVVLTFSNMRLLKSLVPARGITMPFNSLWVGQNEQPMLLSLPESQQQLVLLLVPSTLALLLWLAAYARLTEKQL